MPLARVSEYAVPTPPKRTRAAWPPAGASSTASTERSPRQALQPWAARSSDGFLRMLPDGMIGAAGEGDGDGLGSIAGVRFLGVAGPGRVSEGAGAGAGEVTGAGAGWWPSWI